MERPTAREQALQEAISGGKSKDSTLHHLFRAILEMLTTDDQSVRDCYFDSFKDTFPIEFRMVEWWLLEKEVDEYPDGPDDIFHSAEEDRTWWEKKGKKISKALDGQLEEALVLIGVTGDPDADPDEGAEDEDPFDIDPDVLGNIPN